MQERLSPGIMALEYPGLEEAVAVGRSLVKADWLMGPARKRIFEEPGRSLARIMERWAKRVVERELGLRVVQSRQAFSDDISIVLVKALHRDGFYRVLYVGAVGVNKIKLGKIKGVMPYGVMVFYGRAGSKIYSLLDPIKPRMNRTFPVAGYVFRESRKIVEATDNRVGFQGQVKCERSRGAIIEKQRKYIVLIPPFIIGKWFYYAMYHEAASEPLEELCRGLMA